MPAISSVKVIINVHSGFSDKEEARRSLTEIFAAGGVNSEVLLAGSGAEVAQLAKQAAQEKWTVIVAGGGESFLMCKKNERLGSLGGRRRDRQASVHCFPPGCSMRANPAPQIKKNKIL